MAQGQKYHRHHWAVSTVREGLYSVTVLRCVKCPEVKTQTYPHSRHWSDPEQRAKRLAAATAVLNRLLLQRADNALRTK